MSASLLLAPEPQSVRRARVWVVGELEDLGRADLVDAAELGISELVTNAILHATPPITVRLGGTALHPRVEVHDNSRRAPAVNSDMAEDDKLLRTVGRGLGIVALYSTSWGADVSSDGKVVWFEPALEPSFDTFGEGLEGDLDAELAGDLTDAPSDLSGDVFDLDRAVDALLSGDDRPAELMPVRLVGMPVQVFASFRVWYAEIRRELRLLAFSHGDDYPLATELAALTLQVEQERRLAHGIDALDAAIAGGLVRVDLDYLVPTSAATTMTRVAELLDEVDAFCREHRLLTMAASPQQVQLRRWYTAQFSGQAAGNEPTPWPGSYDIEPTPA
jgi:anti-sigma regulatory factor (Ser/Thr protein kinase)